MNLILSVYAYAAYREFYLPVLNDADYSLVLHAGEFGLSRDLKLKMESVGGEWKIRRDEGYSVFCRDMAFDDQPLRSGDQISVRTRDGETVVKPALTMTWGNFLQVIFDFIIIAFSIFMVIKGINQLKRKEEEKPAEPAAPAGPTQEELLAEIRDLLKNK